DVSGRIADDKLREMFRTCLPNTLDTTVKLKKGGKEAFVITGDIEAMWLRDSGAQLFPYLPLIKEDKDLRELVAGVIRRQTKCLLIDPYANAFNDGATGGGWVKDSTQMRPELHERKWELDSHCYPVRLAYHYWKTSGDSKPFDKQWLKAMWTIYNTMKEQQRFNGNGNYRFLRRTSTPTDSQQGHGWGAPVKPCGLIFSAFRPSDDATQYGFLIPSNMFAVVSLRQMAEMVETINKDERLAKRCRELADEVDGAIKSFAVVNHPKYGRIYAYEVDGFGNYLLMDDANIPSLLSMPYLGYCSAEDEVYKNTRRFVWSKDNPYFFSGKDGEGIGGPHVGVGYAWPMSMIMKGLTTDDKEEMRRCLVELRNTDGETGFIHESFNVNDHKDFTRGWFAWANGLFGELVLKAYRECPEILEHKIDDSGWMNYASFNIRYDNKDDGLNVWRNRCDSLANFIKLNKIDIVGMQEVLDNQKEDLENRLTGYGYVGVGREDGNKKGEYAPIFYRKDKFQVLDSGTFWLSENPESVGSKGWDAACERIATWAKMRDLSTDSIFMAINTHFDHMGTKARRNSALLIIERIKEIVGDRPAVLTGDFNVDERSEAYKTLTTNQYRLLDAHKVARRTCGQDYTWHNFGKNIGRYRSKIDFIFVTPRAEVEYSWIPPLNKMLGIKVGFMSDHNPQIVRVRLFKNVK
nr:glycoside hydrolase family 125 protein [Bacteroidaceae bacterium]